MAAVLEAAMKKNENVSWQAIQEAIPILKVQKMFKPNLKKVIMCIKDQEQLKKIPASDPGNHSVGWCMCQIRHLMFQCKGHKYLAEQGPAGDLEKRLQKWVDEAK